MDYIGVKLFDGDGELTGELRVVGLFTSSAYTQNPNDIPLLRRKLQRVVAASGFSPSGHSGKALISVLEGFPRDELFQIDAEILEDMAQGILRLEERPRTRLFVRRDKFDRFVSASVWLSGSSSRGGDNGLTKKRMPGRCSAAHSTAGAFGSQPVNSASGSYAFNTRETRPELHPKSSTRCPASRGAPAAARLSTTRSP